MEAGKGRWTQGKVNEVDQERTTRTHDAGAVDFVVLESVVLQRDDSRNWRISAIFGIIVPSGTLIPNQR